MNLSGLSFPVCLWALDKNVGDVELMLEAAPTRRDQVSRPRLSAGAVYRGSVVLACAAWEVFIEDLALEALRRVAQRHSSGGHFTAQGQEVAVRTSRKVQREGMEVSDPIAFVRKRDLFLGPFNTPKSQNVDSLFSRAFDLDRFSASWQSNVQGYANAARQLDALVTLRGDIAHRAKSLRTIQRQEVREGLALIERLGILSCNCVRQWLTDATSEAPMHWDLVPLSAVA